MAPSATSVPASLSDQGDGSFVTAAMDVTKEPSLCYNPGALASGLFIGLSL